MGESKRVTIYTDGGADPNPGVGGWAALLRFGRHEKVLTGNALKTTNNRMELEAAIAALSALKQPCTVELHTDSEYLQKGITKWIHKWEAAGWRRGRKPVQNADLWQQLWSLAQQHTIEWHWVRGHAGDPLNERVDQLARQARQALQPTKPLDPALPRLFVRASCQGNPGPGGWGVVLERGEETEQLSGSEQHTTNNRMELVGVIEGLGLLDAGSSLYLLTTSDYVFQGATRWIHGWRQRQWRKKDNNPVANADLWQELDRRLRQYDIHWINAKQEAVQHEALAEASLLAQNATQVA